MKILNRIKNIISYKFKKHEDEFVEEIIKSPIPHICKYCGVITIEDDEKCFMKPEKEYKEGIDFKIIK